MGSGLLSPIWNFGIAGRIHYYVSDVRAIGSDRGDPPLPPPLLVGLLAGEGSSDSELSPLPLKVLTFDPAYGRPCCWCLSQQGIPLRRRRSCPAVVSGENQCSYIVQYVFFSSHEGDGAALP